MSDMVSALDKLLLDIFTTAMEGGVNYWSTCITYHWSFSKDDLTLGTDLEDYAGFYATITETDKVDEDVTVDGVLVINRAVVAKGYRLATTDWRHRLAWSASDPPLVVGPQTDWDFDASDADMIVQLGLFEDVVYG